MSQKSHRDPRAEHSRRVICRAALDQFAESGYAGLRMESVAARAGVSRSTLYRHWPDKAALIADALDTLNVQPDPARDESGATARQRVEILLHHLATALTDSAVSACIPALVHAAATESVVRDFFYAYSAHRRRRLTETIAAGVANGEFSGRIDPEAAAIALSGALFYQRLATSDVADDLFIDRLVDTVMGP